MHVAQAAILRALAYFSGSSAIIMRRALRKRRNCSRYQADF
jgi:hypothetical protein